MKMQINLPQALKEMKWKITTLTDFLEWDGLWDKKRTTKLNTKKKKKKKTWLNYYYLDFIHFNCNISIKSPKNLQRSFKIFCHSHLCLFQERMTQIVSIRWTLSKEKINHMKLTSHRGDSGIKNRAGIKIVQGNIPGRKKNVPSIYWCFFMYFASFIQSRGN